MDSIPKTRGSLLFSVAVILAVGITLRGGTLRISSSDFHIPKGSVVTVDGKPMGTAPCSLELQTGVRHMMRIKSSRGEEFVFHVTTRTLKEGQLIDNVPSWFFNPAAKQSDFRTFAGFTTSTASSASLADAILKAESGARRKMTSVEVNQYNSVQESDSHSRLDSGTSKFYPNLTRGQMDSLNDVNGGMMVMQSFGTSERLEFLEYEIQKIGDKYQVYVLAGEAR